MSYTERARRFLSERAMPVATCCHCRAEFSDDRHPVDPVARYLCPGCADDPQALSALKASLKKVIADLTAENAILRAAAAENASLRAECDRLRRLQSATMPATRRRWVAEPGETA